DLYNMQPSQIVMYTTQYCSDCHRAAAFFEANKIDYIKVDLEDNEEATEFVMNVNRGHRSVPTIIFPDGSALVEPSWDQLKAKTIDK
ncbi:MAG: glutaredoxin domain-containing protein, partial [Anaerolineales bacterium]|nr:glutaredoxin domain-containing protein [Anaerolineales bacterium]